MLSNVIDSLTANLGERFEQGVSRVGDNLYVCFADDPRVLKVIVSPTAPSELRITLVAVDPQHGPIDQASFIHTRSQNLTACLEPLDAFLAVWFD
ncbi:hypothetical protein [Streptomyces sp. NPDC026673]|uniref:hypothetical protein n=1 Tax=Streptomyces sp. NPDC026673 TaxID=3155724 RepID=UPI0033E33A7F